MIKRACDVVVAALGLLLASPPIAAIALALTIEGRGPIFYRSPRLGKGGRVFHLVRFRTMVDAPPDLGPEARPTPVGRFIRNYSLDDLPSLVHVLRGDLSLVGPRPMEVGCVDPTAATWRRILSVRPGFVSYAILCSAHTTTRVALPRRSGSSSTTCPASHSASTCMCSPPRFGRS